MKNIRKIAVFFLEVASLKGRWLVLEKGLIPLMCGFVSFHSSPVVKFATVEADRFTIVARVQKNACNMYGIYGAASFVK